MATPAESFLSFYERSEKMNGSICFSEYFRETFTNQSPIKYCVKYHNNAEEQLRNISNCILKNLHLNSHFKSLADKYYPIDLFEKFYNLIKDIVNKRNKMKIVCPNSCYFCTRARVISKHLNSFKSFIRSIR